MSLTPQVVNWLSTPVTKNVAKKKTQKAIICSIFSECSKLVPNDDYWLPLLQNAGKGKFPSGFSFKDNCLNYKSKNKHFTVEIPEDPYNALAIIINFFSTYIIDSDNDITIDQIVTRDDISKEVPPIWSKVRKNTKLTLLNIFVKEHCTSLNLSINKEKQLFNLLTLASTSGILDNTVQLWNGRIYSINGLIYNPDQGMFILDSNYFNYS